MLLGSLPGSAQSGQILPSTESSIYKMVSSLLDQCSSSWTLLTNLILTSYNPATLPLITQTIPRCLQRPCQECVHFVFFLSSIHLREPLPKEEASLRRTSEQACKNAEEHWLLLLCCHFPHRNPFVCLRHGARTCILSELLSSVFSVMIRMHTIAQHISAQSSVLLMIACCHVLDL